MSHIFTIENNNDELFKHNSVSYKYEQSTRATDGIYYQTNDNYESNRGLYRNNQSDYTKTDVNAYVCDNEEESSPYEYCDQIQTSGDFYGNENGENGYDEIQQQQNIVQKNENKKYIFIQNGICKIIPELMCGTDDEQLSKLIEFVLEEADKKQIILEDSKCYYCKEKQELILYDNLQGLLNFFKFGHQSIFFQNKIDLKIEQKFCIKSDEDIIYISKQDDKNKTIIESYSYDFQDMQFQKLDDKFKTLKIRNLQQLYYKDELKYVYTKVQQDENKQNSQDIEYFKDRLPYHGFNYVYTDINNNQLLYDDDEIYYNTSMVYNQKYKEEILNLIDSLKQIKGQAKYFVYFKTEYKYNQEYSLIVNIVDQDNIENTQNFSIKFTQSDK